MLQEHARFRKKTNQKHTEQWVDRERAWNDANINLKCAKEKNSIRSIYIYTAHIHTHTGTHDICIYKNVYINGDLFESEQEQEQERGGEETTTELNEEEEKK